MPDPETVFLIAFATLAVLAIVYQLAVVKSQNVGLRKKLFLPLNIAVPVLMIGTMYLMNFPAIIILIAIPLATGVTLINIKITSFCETCGKPVISFFMFPKENFCSKCGSKLTT